MMQEPRQIAVNRIYQLLWKAFGSQHWWPGESSLEVIVGAVLTQNTNWQNVVKAIDNLKAHKFLSLDAIHNCTQPELAELIKPSGFFNVKSHD